MDNHEAAERHFEQAVGLARGALQALLLVNGGAASALIALTDKAGGKDYALASVLFGCGAIATVVAYATAYFSQLYYANHRFGVAQNESAETDYRLHRIFQVLTIVIVVIALGFSVVGGGTALCTARGC